MLGVRGGRVNRHYAGMRLCGAGCNSMPTLQVVMRPRVRRGITLRSSGPDLRARVAWRARIEQQPLWASNLTVFFDRADLLSSTACRSPDQGRLGFAE